MWVDNATPDILEVFPEARQIVAVFISNEKRRPEAKERENELHLYVVTGQPGQKRLSPKRLAKLIRGHWGIENRLHHRLDRTLREDDQKIGANRGALLLSLLRKLSLVAIDKLGPKANQKRYLPENQAIVRVKPYKAVKLLNKRIA